MVSVTKIKSQYLFRNFFLVFSWEVDEVIKLCSYEKGNCRLPSIILYVGHRGGTLLNPLACRYHSLIELSVDFRLKSNINNMATASLQTKGNILTNSR